MTSSNKKLIESVLNKLLEVGFCMRGYRVVTGITGNTSLPLASIDTVIPPRKQDEVSDQVNGSIIDFEASLGKLSKYNATLIKSLTLVIYQISSDDKITFKESTDSDEGYTIWERISIVKKGETNTNSCSCIRLSSNWLCSSAYYYMLAIGMPPPFTIANLAKIS